MILSDLLKADVYNKAVGGERFILELLSCKYPSAKIFALTPIWRKDYKGQYNCREFSFVADYIEKVIAKIDNVYCLHGFDFVPHQEKMYGDLRLHPNDDGFGHFANNMHEDIKNMI